MNIVKQFIKKWMIPPGIVILLAKIRKHLNRSGLSADERELLARNLDIKDRHLGSRCFIIGAGSSIAKQDLKRLAGECVISVSNTFVHPDYSVFKPKYHVVPNILLGHGVLYPREQFVEWLREMEQKTLNAEMFFHIGDRELIESNGLFVDRIIHWNDYCQWDGSDSFPLDLARVPNIWSVSELAITAAIYMGFDKIYLLGFDHDWFNGPMVYFYNHKTQHKMKPSDEKLAFADAEFQMRRHADMFKKYKYLYQMKENIYNANANPNHYLDVFPKVKYESLFAADVGHETH